MTTTDRDQPDITITQGHTRNPIPWAISLVTILALSVTAGAFGFLAFYITHLAPQIQDYAGLAATLFGLGAIMTLLLLGAQVHRLLTVDHSIYRFYPDALAVEIKTWRGASTHERYAYTAVRHVGMPSLGRLHLHLIQDESRVVKKTLRLPLAISEDTLDECVDYLRARAPGSLFSIQQHRELSLSIEPESSDLWSLDPEWPGQATEVHTTSIRHGEIRIDKAHNLLHRRQRNTVENATGRALLRIDRDEIRTASGVVVGVVRDGPGFGASATLFDGRRYALGKAFTLEGESIAAVGRDGGDSVSVKFEQPIATVLAVILFLAYTK